MHHHCPYNGDLSEIGADRRGEPVYRCGCGRVWETAERNIDGADVMTLAEVEYSVPREPVGEPGAVLSLRLYLVR